MTTKIAKFEAQEKANAYARCELAAVIHAACAGGLHRTTDWWIDALAVGQHVDREFVASLIDDLSGADVIRFEYSESGDQYIVLDHS